MKKIIIYQENSESITLFDNDVSNLELYSKKISEILSSSKVCILETSSKVCILRPSKIISIIIDDNKENIDKTTEIHEEIMNDIIKD